MNILVQLPEILLIISNTIQNQIIEVLADQVLADQVKQNILQKVQAVKWYTVIADEVTDVSTKEQLSIVLRYVDSVSLVDREDLVYFTECDTGISGQNLAEKTMTYLEALGLDLSNLRGQGYDGVSNMAGAIKGTAAIITKQYPLAIYWHCFSLSQPCNCEIIGSNKGQKHDGCCWESVPVLCSSS